MNVGGSLMGCGQVLKDVSKSYGNFELGPVDLEGEPGFVVAVVGSNGGGKSS